MQHPMPKDDLTGSQYLKDNAAKNVLRYCQIQTTAGQDGGPICAHTKAGSIVIGVHSGTKGSYNFGTFGVSFQQDAYTKFTYDLDKGIQPILET